MKSSIRILICGAAAFALGGCQSLWSDLGFGPKDSGSESALASDTQRIDLGRQALRMQAPGTAIHHFERAALDAEHAPEAFNGMGVAYAMLGREDLSERFFNAALMLKPQDERFSRNLARLYNSDIGNSRRARAKEEAATLQALADAKAEAIAEGLLPEEHTSIERRSGITIGQSKRASVSRTGRGEIVIRSAQTSQSGASSIEVASRRKTIVTKPAEPQVDGAVRNESMPIAAKDAGPKTIKFALNRTNTKASKKLTATADSGYPVRIKLGRN